MEVEKIYEYKNSNGKSIIIKRKWTNKEETTNRREALNNYFEQNKDKIANMKNYKAVYNDYNSNNPDYNVSYKTILKRLHKLYGMKNKRHIIKEPDNEIL